MDSKENLADSDERTDPSAGRAVAVALLARRDFATAEMRAKLLARGFASGVAEELIATLCASGILDDRRFAENYVSWHSGRGQGPFRIKAELRRRGLPEALVDAALESVPDWNELARRVRRSKFGREAPASWAEKARQGRFLQYRGFSADHIRAATGADPDLD